MSCGEIRPRLGALLEATASEAMRRGAPADSVDEAARACLRRFGDTGRPPVARLEAYFWGVLRRRALRGGAPALRNRLLVASFAEELTAAGHTAAMVYEELQRVYGGAADPALLAEYRPPRAAHAA